MEILITRFAPYKDKDDAMIDSPVAAIIYDRSIMTSQREFRVKSSWICRTFAREGGRLPEATIVGRLT